MIFSDFLAFLYQYFSTFPNIIVNENDIMCVCMWGGGVSVVVFAGVCLPACMHMHVCACTCMCACTLKFSGPHCFCKKLVGY